MNLTKKILNRVIDVLESIYLEDFDELVVLNAYLLKNHGYCLGELMDVDIVSFMDALSDKGFLFTWDVLEEVIDFIPRKSDSDQKEVLNELPDSVLTKIQSYQRRIRDFVTGKRTIIV